MGEFGPAILVPLKERPAANGDTVWVRPEVRDLLAVASTTRTSLRP